MSARLRRRSYRFLANARGFSAVEMTMAASLLPIVLVATYTSFESSRITYTAGSAKVDIQQNARVAMESLEGDLRLAGYGFPTDIAVVTPQLKVTSATPTAVTFRADLTNASTILSGDANAGDTTLAVTDASGIRAGDAIYLINGGQWETLTVSSVPSGTNTLRVPGPGTTRAYPRGTQVGRPKSINYAWSAGTLSKDDGEGGGLAPVADRVQAFQLRYFDATDVEIAPANLATSLGNIRRFQITITAQSASTGGSQTFSLTSNVRPRNL